MTKRRLPRARPWTALLLLALPAAAGCGAGDATAPEGGGPQGSSPATVEVGLARPSLAVGDTLRLTATVRSASGEVLSAGVSWASGTASATVDAGGLVTAVSPGAATVTATAGGASGRASFTVEARQPSPEPPAPTPPAPTVIPLARFTRLPFDLPAVGGITPLGTLGNGTRASPELGHPYGNERHFLWHRSPGVEYPVYAPATARIVAFRESTSNDFRVDLLLYQGEDGKRVVSYLDHLTSLDPALAARLAPRIEGGIRVTSNTVPVSPALEVEAGTVLGLAGMTPVNWDWGVVDEREAAVARPESFYSDITMYAHPAYDYATPEVQAQLRALTGQWDAGTGRLVKREGDPPMGVFSVDREGTLSGIWHQRYETAPHPYAVSINPSSLDPSRLQMLLQVPDLDLFGRYVGIRLEASGSVNRDPAGVTAATGTVAYLLANGVEDGVLYARVNVDGTITLEAVRGAAAADPAFRFGPRAVTLRR